MQEYLQLHGSFPLCACGCGLEVSIDRDGRPGRVHGTHRANSFEKAVAARVEGNIPIDKFRAAVHKIRGEKGWTLKQTAEKGGLSYNQMSNIMYSTRRKSVSKEWATPFFRRLAGLPAPLTAFQQARIDREIKAERRVDDSWDDHTEY